MDQLINTLMDRYSFGKGGTPSPFGGGTPSYNTGLWQGYAPKPMQQPYGSYTGAPQTAFSPYNSMPITGGPTTMPVPVSRPTVSPYSGAPATTSPVSPLTGPTKSSPNAMPYSGPAMTTMATGAVR